MKKERAIFNFKFGHCYFYINYIVKKVVNIN